MNNSTVIIDGGTVDGSSPGSLDTPRGLFLRNSTATVNNATIISTTDIGLSVNDALGGPGSTATVTKSTISGFGRGVNINGPSVLTLVNTQVTGTGSGSGGVVADGVGLAMLDGIVTLQDSTVTGSNRGAVLATDLRGLSPDQLTVDHSSLIGTTGSAILVSTANGRQTNATIVVQNGSTLSGGNGTILEVGELSTVDRPTTVNFTADNSTLTGNVQVVAGSTANITLRNDASLTGDMTNVNDVSIDSTSRWNMLDDSNVNSLALSGGTVNLHAANAGFHTLTAGSLTGTGTFELGTDLAAHQSDLLNVTGNATGNHQLLIENTGTEPPKEDHAQQVVHTGSGDAAFSVVGGVVDAGTFTYNLEQRGTDWFLVQARDDNGDPIPTPSTETVIDLAGAAPTVWYGELATLRSRMGELRYGHDQGGAWARTYGNKFNVSPADSSAYSQTQGGVSFGVDTPLPSADGQWLIGVMGGYSHSDLDIQRGSSGDVDSYYLGLYSTWLSTSGYYLDAVAKINRFHNSADAQMDDGQKSKGSYSNYGMGVSVEGGKHIELADRWFVEPYAQASVLWVEGKDFQLDNGLDADSNDAKSLLGEIGTHVGRTYPLAKGGFIQPYVKVAVAQEFAKSNRVSVNGTSFNDDLSGTRGKLGTGVAAQLTDVLQVHADLDYSNGDHIEQPWGVNVGLRYSW
ncbi:autotransporter outer membrane beta-barrel domain-containing protein [Pseudomonas sp. NA-150]|uniref:autotransporter outer membrane beta-barrel domain-containing protein n=1 Tax=Pseudomonas sp. NA-150 TaxID=3367525 RepID=UPI0037CC29BE